MKLLQYQFNLHIKMYERSDWILYSASDHHQISFSSTLWNDDLSLSISKKIFLPIRVSIIIQTSLSCAVIWNINVIKSSPQINLICLSGSLREATLNMMSKWVFQYDKLKW